MEHTLGEGARADCEVGFSSGVQFVRTSVLQHRQLLGRVSLLKSGLEPMSQRSCSSNTASIQTTAASSPKDVVHKFTVV